MPLEPEGYSGNSKWSRRVICFATAICIVFLFVSFLKIIKKTCVTSRFSPSVIRRRTQGVNLNENNQNVNSLDSQSRGLASAVIHSLPVIQFRAEIGDSSCKGNSNEECAVCLGEFAEGEWLRLLPICTHLFHAYCIDTWFCSHSSCPLCRTDVLHGFSSNSPFVSMVAPLETLEREGISQERLTELHHLESVEIQNHFRWEAIADAAQPGPASDEAVPSVASSIRVVYHH